MNEQIDDFKEVRDCEYKGEHYSARDNGAVMRHPRPGKAPRPSDEKWTFGKKDEKTGYMIFGTHRVHIIVARAFHGPHDSKVYVVDHRDTNRCNNRVENLRWFTRLENALNNPITRKRIEWLCGGDIQKFIDDPSCLRAEGKNQDIAWMRTVTSEEAKNALENLGGWATKPNVVGKANTSKVRATASADKEWMFKPPKVQSQTNSNAYNPEAWRKQIVELKRKGIELQINGGAYSQSAVPALSPTIAYQLDWRTPSEFTSCPAEYSDNLLIEYASNLVEGAVFCKNDLGVFAVVQTVLYDNNSKLLVLTKISGGLKSYALALVFAREGRVYHKSQGTFFDKNGALKIMSELQGR